MRVAAKARLGLDEIVVQNTQRSELLLAAVEIGKVKVKTRLEPVCGLGNVQ